MSKHPIRRRALAWLLSFVCVLGLLPPADVSAASDVPDTITLTKADYGTGTSFGGLNQYEAPGGLGTVTLHNFRMDVDGKQVTGLCGDHRKGMGTRYQGESWANPGPVSENLYPLLAYYYWSCENDALFNGGESGSSGSTATPAAPAAPPSPLSLD